MRKVTFLFAIVAMFAIASCGNSTSETPATTTADSTKVDSTVVSTVDSVAVKAVDTASKAK